MLQHSEKYRNDVSLVKAMNITIVSQNVVRLCMRLFQIPDLSALARRGVDSVVKAICIHEMQRVPAHPEAATYNMYALIADTFTHCLNSPCT